MVSKSIFLFSHLAPSQVPGELPGLKRTPCCKCKATCTKLHSSVGVCTLPACIRHNSASWAGTGVLLLLILFILSDRDVPCQAHHVGRVHQEDVSGQDLSSVPHLLTIQVVFPRTSCTPLTCHRAAFAVWEHSRIPTATSKAEPQVLPTFLW